MRKNYPDEFYINFLAWFKLACAQLPTLTGGKRLKEVNYVQIVR